MEWYWWVLIGVGVVVIGYIKLKILKKMMNKPQEEYENEE